MRPNFFVNTPDILHAYLQYGGPAAFKVRAALAATGPPAGASTPATSCSSTSRSSRAARSTSTRRSTRSASATGPAPTAEGSTLAPYLTRLNEIRRAHPALQRLRNLASIHRSDDDHVLVFSQARPPDDVDTVIVVVNLDPHGTRETMVHLDMPALGLDWHDTFVVHDEITGDDWTLGPAQLRAARPRPRARPHLTVGRTR